MIKTILVIGIVVVILLAGAYIYFTYRLRHVKDSHNLARQIDKSVLSFIESGKSYGISIGVYKAGKEFIKGYASGKTGAIGPDGNTLFELASTSKLFTTSTLQILEDKGQLSVHDRIATFLDSKVRLPDVAQHTTLLHLATHRSGFPSLPQSFIDKMTDESNPYSGLQNQDIYDYLADCRNKKSEGDFAYSNFGMGLLGHILALHREKAYEDVVKEELLFPLGMTHTFVTVPDTMRSLMIQGYNEHGAESPVWEDKVLTGAGSFLSNANDMMKFIRANLSPGSSPVSPSLLKTHHPQPGRETGLGWILPSFIERKLFRNDEIIWHNGMAGGYSSFLLINKTQSYGIILLSNKAEDVTSLGMKLSLLARNHSWE